MKELWNKALSYFGLAEEEGYDDEYDEYDDDRIYNSATSTVRKITRTPDLSRAERAALRPVSAPPVRVNIVEPRSFNDAQQIADKFKAKQPVIVNLQQIDAELAKRLIDFGSGLTYGLGGGMQRIAEKVFLLTPSNVEVSAEEKRRLRERGFIFNQF
ncbi:MAG: cell division protein SepF [Actinomycetota bacterium]|nr:cell division protein SepF [Actinomycetota bacterium]